MASCNSKQFVKNEALENPYLELQLEVEKRMVPLKPSNNRCPQDATRERCNLQCKYNHFEAGDLVIDSWELKCLDCGYRETIAYRSDDEDLAEVTDNPKKCPFCDRCDLAPGRSPCSS